jgi:selenocysteine-specific elongation factor
LDPSSFDQLIAGRSDITAEGANVRLDTHEVAFDETQKRERNDLMAKLEGAGLTPPVEKELGVDAALLRSLVTSGELVKVADFYLLTATAESIRKQVRDAIEERGPLTIADIRDLLGTTRKYAVPLCEWLDATGATRRQGDVRTLGPKP